MTHCLSPFFIEISARRALESAMDQVFKRDVIRASPGWLEEAFTRIGRLIQRGWFPPRLPVFVDQQCPYAFLEIPHHAVKGRAATYSDGRHQPMKAAGHDR